MILLQMSASLHILFHGKDRFHTDWRSVPAQPDYFKAGEDLQEGEEFEGKAAIALSDAQEERKDNGTDELHIPVGTVHAWLRRLLDGGLKSLHDKHRSGRPSRLSGEKLKELRQDLIRGPKANGFDAPFWTTRREWSSST